MAKGNDAVAGADVESRELVRKLLAVTLWQGGASYDVIAKMTGKRKDWVVDTLKGLPDRRRK